VEWLVSGGKCRGALQRSDGLQLQGHAQAAQDCGADEYNINYCKGVEAKNSDQTPDINCNSENGKSLAQAASMCAAIKTAKIEVFTVGFQVNATAKTFLTACATDASHYYDATTEVALQAAFRDIALKIATLRLTN
jgi:hypothetical protein